MSALMEKIKQITHPSHELKRKDVLWVLEMIKKKMVDQESLLLHLSQPQLLKSYQAYAEITMSMLHAHSFLAYESTQIKHLIQTATEVFFEPMQS